MASRQARHYDNIHDDYSRHYYDPTALRYRERFILDFLLKDIPLDGCRIADLACGDGYTSLSIKKRFPSAQIFGFDVSAAACRAYEQNVGAECFNIDITSNEVSSLPVGQSSFDAAMIVGGLHHCGDQVPRALANIAGLLVDGGYFLMMEPNRQFAGESLRRLWYRLDKYFKEDEETSFNHDSLLEEAHDFEIDAVAHVGGPAYYLILNSMLFRLPTSIKPHIATVLFPLEESFNRLPFSPLFPAFLARWRKLPSA